LSKAVYMPMLECDPSTMRKTLDWLDDHFGGAEGYARSHGFTEADLQQFQVRWCIA
jgi:hypothetical protein